MAMLAGAGSVLAQPPAAAAPPATAPALPAPAESLPATPPAPLPPLTPRPAIDPAAIAPPRTGCADGLGGTCGGCANGYDFTRPGYWGGGLYGSAEYLLYKIKSAPMPPTGLIVPFTASGFNSLVSNTNFPDGGETELAGRSGGRFTLGYWCHPDRLLGIEATYFQLERKMDGFSGSQIADLPINLNVIQNITTTGAGTVAITQVPLAITLPGELRVLATGATGPVQFWGTEINARSTRCVYGGWILDALMGFRYMEFSEDFNVAESIRLQVADAINLSGPGPIPPNPLPPIPQPITGLRDIVTVNTVDTVATRNRFYGTQIGGAWQWYALPKVVFAGFGKIGVGAMVQDVFMQGATTTISAVPGGTGTTTTPGGLLSPLTGTVNASRTRYAVIPEVNMSLGYQITPWLRMSVGYNLIYISSVVRPGDQVGSSQQTTTISLAGQATTVTQTQPAFRYHDNDFWAQGLTAGFQVRW